MTLLEVGQTFAYKVIRQLQDELKEKGYLVNPNAKVPIKYFCERYGFDVEEAKSILEKVA